MNKVNVYTTSKKETLIGQATFLTYGVSYEELQNGVGQYTTAVIKWADGSVEEIYVGCIQFIEESETFTELKIPETLETQADCYIALLAGKTLVYKADEEINPFALICLKDGFLFNLVSNEIDRGWAFDRAAQNWEIYKK